MGKSQSGAPLREGYPKDQSWVLFYFVVFADDLPTVVKQCTVNLYADDTNSLLLLQEVKCALEAYMHGGSSELH